MYLNVYTPFDLSIVLVVGCRASDFQLHHKFSMNHGWITVESPHIEQWRNWVKSSPPDLRCLVTLNEKFKLWTKLNQALFCPPSCKVKYLLLTGMICMWYLGMNLTITLVWMRPSLEPVIIAWFITCPVVMILRLLLTHLFWTFISATSQEPDSQDLDKGRLVTHIPYTSHTWGSIEY